MDLKIDLCNVKAEELKTIDLDTVDINLPAPATEPQRQYYFMAKCRQYVMAQSKRLGRPLRSEVVTFGCQMNPASEIRKTA